MLQPAYYIGISEKILQFKGKQFYSLVTLLVFGLFMDFRNAAAIQRSERRLDEHGVKLEDLNSKFDFVVAYISEQEKRDAKQDDRLKKLEDKDKQQDDKDNQQDEEIKKIKNGEKDKKNDDKST